MCASRPTSRKSLEARFVWDPDMTRSSRWFTASCKALCTTMPTQDLRDRKAAKQLPSFCSLGCTANDYVSIDLHTVKESIHYVPTSLFLTLAALRSALALQIDTIPINVLHVTLSRVLEQAYYVFAKPLLACLSAPYLPALSRRAYLQSLRRHEEH